MFFVVIYGRGASELRALEFRGCDLTAECLFARENVRVRFPAAAPEFNHESTLIDTNQKSFLLIRVHSWFLTGRAPACAAEPPKLSVRGAAPRRPAIFSAEL